MEETKVYSVAEFAKIMKISMSMAYLMIRERKVKHVRCGDRVLIPVWVVDELLAGAR